MPRLTNEAGLPQALYEAIANDSYSRGDSDISVTQLISPPRQVELLRVHDNELTEDASERVYSLLGQAIHTILERASKTGVAEQRLYADVLGWRLSGQVDRLDGTTIADFKTASVNEITYGVKAERELQLNCYAFLARENGIEVERVEAIFILRDWSKRRASQDPTYPQKQVVVHELPLWSAEKARAYVEERVALHKDTRYHYERARMLPNRQLSLPECSDEERWAQGDVYAVMKIGNKRAVKLCDWQAEADVYVQQHNPAHKGLLYVERRAGESIRCSTYCSVSAICEQWKALREN